MGLDKVDLRKEINKRQIWIILIEKSQCTSKLYKFKFTYI